MANKKDEARFTIRFNQENPRHSRAMQLLNNHGKGMACLIADALCMYIHYGADFINDLVTETTTTTQAVPSKNNLPNTLNTALDSFY